MSRAAEEGTINGCQIAPRAPKVTHLLFVDDSFLFFKVDVTESRKLKSLLNGYGSTSGQSINYQKFSVFFRANVRRDKQEAIKFILEVQNDLKDSRYLGLPSLIGRSKKSFFNYVKERVWRRVQDWNNKTLSKAGKTIMVKNVGQSIPSYGMSCFLLPKLLCGDIERMLNGYWWRSSGSNIRDVRWLGWDKMSCSKNAGGFGFRDLHGFNLALLGKHIWSFCNKPDSLIARLYKARYF